MRISSNGGLAGLIELGGGLAVKLLRPHLPGERPLVSKAGDFVVGKIIRPPALPHEPPLTLAEAERRKHLYLIGATGCGKTNLLLRLIDQELASHRSICVIDLRGDLVDRILHRLASTLEPADLQGRLCLIDLRNEDYAIPLNPLTGSGDDYMRALQLMEVVERNAESWGVQLEETLRNSLIALAQSGWSLLEIEPLLTHQAFRKQVMARVQDPYVRAFFQRYDRLFKDKQLVWALAVLNKVTALISVPALRCLFGSRTGLDWQQLLNDQPEQIILIALAVDRFHEASHLVGGLCVASIQNAVMARANIPEAERLPTTLIVDEFETMASEAFESIIAEGRRFGLSLVLAHQNLAQLDRKLREVVRNNVHVQLYFQTGALDASDLATEIISAQTREQNRLALISQGVGQAYVVRRGLPSVQVATALAADPDAPTDKVEALRLAALQGYGHPRQQIEAELRQRAAQIYNSSKTSSDPQVQIRHDKRPPNH